MLKKIIRKTKEKAKKIKNRTDSIHADTTARAALIIRDKKEKMGINIEILSKKMGAKKITKISLGY